MTSAERIPITLTVNGRLHRLAVAPDETLAEVLRQRLHLTGVKIGCQEAECGACTVEVDGEAVLSCIYPAVRADGKQVLTVEGLAQGEGPEFTLHPLQEAFVQHGAVQCGFCTPGQLMAAHALLEHNPDPSREEIREALKDNLCRCGAYLAIEEAVQAAAQALRTGGPPPPPNLPPSSHPGRVVGRPHIRPDAVDKVTGRALYTDDLHFEGMLYARVRRAEVPHGILRRVEVAQARAVPGVRAVLTAADLPAARYHGLFVDDWPILVGVGERIRYVGDALALVAAETPQAAAQAVARIEVTIDPLPPLTDPVEALRPEAPALHPGGNLLKHIKVRKGDVEQGFAEADVILEHTFWTPPYDHAFMEPESSVAVPLPQGRMAVYVGSQIPYADRRQVAAALGWPEERVHIVGQTMGGGFGGKEDIAGQIHAALLAQATGRPVKLTYDRRESLIAHPKRHATRIRVRIGAKRDGRLTAVQTELYGDTGAYASLGEKVMTRATTHSAGPYVVPHVRSDCYAVYTNNPPAGAFRGFGVTQSAFAIESMMDMLAERLGMDPVALRRQNALRVGTATSTGQVLRESVGLLECIDRVEAEMRRLTPGADPFRPRPVPGAPHKVRAWGFAAAFKNTGLGGGAPDESTAEVELLSEGRFEVRTSAAELGQGLVSVLQIVVAETLAVPLEQVKVLVMDTDRTPDGGPTTASRQTFVTGNAARLAAQVLADALRSALAERYDCSPERIRFAASGLDLCGRSLPWPQVAAEMRALGRPPRVRYTYRAPETHPLGQGGDMHFAYAFAAQAAEVEVDTRTGEVRVLRVISATDAGTVMNPLTLKGQIEGGVIMGIGTALTERFILEEGQVITDRLARYRMPSIGLTPEIVPILVEHPVKAGPFGAKGVGEIVSVPTAPAITNAIYHAVGVRVDRLPVEQEALVLQGDSGKD